LLADNNGKSGNSCRKTPQSKPVARHRVPRRVSGKWYAAWVEFFRVKSNVAFWNIWVNNQLQCENTTVLIYLDQIKINFFICEF